MNVYTAIMRAADSIERRPGGFNFFSSYIPDGCGTPGCALGWIALNMGKHFQSGGTWNSPKLHAAIGSAGDIDFYDRMDALLPGWAYDAPKCARALRLYAEKYHGDENRKLPVKHEGIPASVRQIFERVAA